MDRESFGKTCDEMEQSMRSAFSKPDRLALFTILEAFNNIVVLETKQSNAN